jgi:hypothetical protein
MMADLTRLGAVELVKHEVRELKRMLKALLAVVFVSLAIIGASSIVSARVASDTKDIGQQNRAFLRNFSDYMRCLVVPDEALYKSMGKAAYFDHCDVLLFRGTGLKPSLREDPTTTTSSP